VLKGSYRGCRDKPHNECHCKRYGDRVGRDPARGPVG
jgi:hypothetical protein